MPNGHMSFPMSNQPGHPPSGPGNNPGGPQQPLNMQGMMSGQRTMGQFWFISDEYRSHDQLKVASHNPNNQGKAWSRCRVTNTWARCPGRCCRQTDPRPWATTPGISNKRIPRITLSSSDVLRVDPVPLVRVGSPTPVHLWLTDYLPALRRLTSTKSMANLCAFQTHSYQNSSRI
jgi:hypothetical protein